MKLARLLRSFLRNQAGLEVGYAKYYPVGTDRKVYDVYLPNVPIDTIFDVGANIGQTAKAFAQSHPQAQIFSFEPFERNYRILEKSLPHVSKHRSFQCALSDRNGELEILTDNVPYSQWNSLSQDKQEFLRLSTEASKETVVLLTGDDFCRQHNISSISILKTDTEGHDLEVLRGFERMLKEGRIYSVLVEVGFSNDKSHSSFQSINNYLAEVNITLAGFYDISHRANGKCDYANALFVKNI